MMASISTVPLDHKLVHLDLKGAAPKLSYIEQVLPVLKGWGVTGLLVEYEDMFPYQDGINALAAPYAYSIEDINTLQRLALENNMIIIPLVQTFGHMEFVLKHSRFKHLREVENFPMALCPSNPESLRLVCHMVDQVMAAHTGLQWFHIGCDEVYHLGMCDHCQHLIEEENITPQQLFFQHVKNVALHFKEHYPKVTPIVWDDMFRFAETSVLLESGLKDLVEPMVWHYLTTFQLPPDIWEKLAAIFPNIWVASAFKGATGTHACVTSIAYHMENHFMWLAVLQAEQHRFKSIRGIALTGWQRYDHYAVLCELLPQAMPSLAICLNIVKTGSLSPQAHKSISNDLGFSDELPLNPFKCVEIPSCDFPGFTIYQLMLKFLLVHTECQKFLFSDGVLTWMNEFNIKRNFTNPVHVGPILNSAIVLLEQIEELYQRVETALEVIYFQNTVDEWLGSHLQPLLAKFQDFVQTAKQQLSIAQQECVP